MESQTVGTMGGPQCVYRHHHGGLTTSFLGLMSTVKSLARVPFGRGIVTETQVKS